MSQLVDMRVSELLMSRLCHEIVGPVGAVNNGVELIEEMGEAMGEDAMALIGNSARQAAARLQFHRVAYGRTGRKETRAPDLRAIAQGALSGGRVKLEWEMGAIAPDIPEGAGGLILILIDMGATALPRGGTVSVRVARAVEVTAAGPGAALPEDLVRAMDVAADIDTLSARTVQGYWAALLADGLGRSLRVSPDGPDRLRLGV